MKLNGIEIPDAVEVEVKKWVERQSSFTTPSAIKVIQSIIARYPDVKVKRSTALHSEPGVYLDRVADRMFRVWKNAGLIRYSNNTKRWSVLANTSKESQ